MPPLKSATKMDAIEIPSVKAELVGVSVPKTATDMVPKLMKIVPKAAIMKVNPIADAAQKVITDKLAVEITAPKKPVVQNAIVDIVRDTAVGSNSGRSLVETDLKRSVANVTLEKAVVNTVWEIVLTYLQRKQILKKEKCMMALGWLQKIFLPR